MKKVTKYTHGNYRGFCFAEKFQCTKNGTLFYLIFAFLDEIIIMLKEWKGEMNIAKK